MNLVDVHCHLNHHDFRNDLDQVIDRARKAGLKAIIVSGTNTPCNREVLELSQKYPIIKVSLGFHPIDALGLSEGDTGIPKQNQPINLDEEFKFIEENKDQIVSIGEAGLDFHWDKDNHEKQKNIFRKIIKFALKIKKPIVVHCWEAEEEAIDILEKEIKRRAVKEGEFKNEIPVIMHCFNGRKSLISRARDLGFYFSVPPSILRIGNFQTLVKKVGLKQLLTETDAPWQSPYKGKRNEPAFVAEAVRKIAEIKEVSEEEAAGQIWQNCQKVFVKI